jgi:hypothetical protein
VAYYEAEALTELDSFETDTALLAAILASLVAVADILLVAELMLFWVLVDYELELAVADAL